jgi:hypothetical protein
VIGAQVVPLSVCLDVRCSGPQASASPSQFTFVVGAVVVLLVAIWSWFSFITAGFFHTFWDLVPSLGVVLWCLFDTYTVMFQQQHVRAEGLRTRATMAVVMWATSLGLYALLVDLMSAQPPVLPSVLYDAVLFVFGYYLVRNNDQT